MQTGTAMGEVSNYLQPDHFDNDKQNMNDLLGQNPLLLLARTCQNIGVESSNATTASTDPLKIAYKAGSAGGIFPSPTSTMKAFNRNTPPQSTSSRNSTAKMGGSASHSSPTVTASYSSVTAHSPKAAAGSAHHPASASSHGSNETDLYIPPSSNSLIQLARLSSSLNLPSPTSSGMAERQKRNRSGEPKYLSAHVALSTAPLNGSRQQKRTRRQSFGRTTSSSSATSSSNKPIDFSSSHFPSQSSPLSTSSSVSPSSLRSTPLTHNSPPPPPTQQQQQHISPTNSFEMIKSLMGLTTNPESGSCGLEAFYGMGGILGTSPDHLRDLLTTLAQSLTTRSAPPSKVEPPKAAIPVSDPSTQCLYCGHVCSDMGSLVQHVYTHLASLHKQQAETATPQVVLPPPPPPPAPPVSAPSSPLDLASCYARFFQKTTEALPAVQLPSTATTDPNSLFLAWLNVLSSPAYSEALVGSRR